LADFFFLSGTQVIATTEQEWKRGRMMKISSQRRLSGALFTIFVFAALAVPHASARVHHSDGWARERFAAAERMREALNGRPPAERTRHDYQRVLNSYRSVYLGAPTSTKADPSVVAVAETLVEMGRHFDDDKILHSAIDQYKFLRREYPGSKFRCDALFTIGEIYKDDLNDPANARAAFQEFLRRYPQNHLSENARATIAELDKDVQAQKAAESQKSAKKHVIGGGKDLQVSGQNDGENALAVNAESRRGRLPRVTAIRHWSTPDYTRVAIDIEGDVKFSSQRIDSPARIFFDLRDTKLASTLVGKSFDVDDGFLKKVRLAQFSPGCTRVVLEVDTLATYDAFLLPNPYRLIVDIHGKNGREKPSLNAEETKGMQEIEERDTPAGAGVKAETAEPNDGAETAAGSGNDQPVAVKESGNESKVIANGLAAKTDSPATIKTQAPVVKKIVEADDDDETVGSTRRKGTTAKAAVARQVKPVKKEEPQADTDAGPSTQGADDADDSGQSQSESSSHVSISSKLKGSYDFTSREARPTASGDRSLIRTLGLKIGKIVIDPGHGGHDTGTIGPNGLEEKELVLDVGRRLGKMLESRLGAEVVYTRKDDTFIPLETRTAIANQARADLFVSIHANSSRDSAARGVETYYLNFTSSPEALEVAARENAVSEKSIFELQDLVKKIALKEKIEESREFASDVQQALHNGLAVKSPAIRDRGVKKAPFIVLIGANMPSILAEISFVSNPTDEHRLETAEYRQRIAESLYRGIAKYVNGLSGVKVASKMEKAAGQ
jgi:N-acetylmuramoyl-L-alanine amidase